MHPDAKQLWKQYRNPHCTECPLHKEAQTICLMGDGPVPAEVMVIGEAPGFREDDVRKPFSGKSGRYLDQILERHGLSRDSLFVTNAVKCRPPENRTPSKSEYKACRHYLDDELREVNPDYILTLGNGGLSLLKKSGIMKHRGNVTEFNDAIVLPTIHPAAVLRNPRFEQLFSADIGLFARTVRGEESRATPPKIYFVQNPKALRVMLDRIMNADAVAYDLETSTGGEYADNAVIATIAVAVSPSIAFCVPISHPQSRWKRPDKVLAAVGRALMYTKAKIVAQNAKFDDRWMQHFAFDIQTDFDTMIAAHLLDENQLKGLKVLGLVHLGVDPWGIDASKVMETPLRKVAIYNARDAAYTLRLYYLFRKELMKPGFERSLRLFVKLLMPASRALTRVERNGLWVDQSRLSKRLIETESHISECSKKLALSYGMEANWNSPVKVADLLFNVLKCKPVEFTKNGALSTKESVLLKLRAAHRGTATGKVMDLLMEYRKWAKYKGTYLGNYAQALDGQSRMHPNYKITGTVTGRLSSGKDDERAAPKERGLNAQQVPRDSFIRGVIGAPPGWRFVEADFSQIELRIIAHISRDATMQRLFLLDEDIHLQMAVRLTGKSPHLVEKEERKKAKSVNFGYCFGMGWRKFIEYAFDNYDVVVTDEEAMKSRDLFFDTFRALKGWHARQRRLAQTYRQVSSPIGRIRHLPDILSEEKSVREEAERQAINSPVQSMASDMMMLAMVLLDKRLPHDEARIVGSVHDSLLFEVREDCVNKWVPIIKHTMENLPLREKFGVRLTVPIKADVTVGQHWSEGKPWVS